MPCVNKNPYVLGFHDLPLVSCFNYLQLLSLDVNQCQQCKEFRKVICCQQIQFYVYLEKSLSLSGCFHISKIVARVPECCCPLSPHQSTLTLMS